MRSAAGTAPNLQSLSNNPISIATGSQSNDIDLTPCPFPQFLARLCAPAIGTKDGSYFIRCSGTKRTNADTSDTASILTLDGDSRIDENGEVIKDGGAVSPESVHKLLSDMKINHYIYTSFSNDVDHHKYRVVIPCEYSREQLPHLLTWIFKQLHTAKIMLENAKENRAWSQAWFFPRVPDEARKGLFKFYEFSDGTNLNATGTTKAWLKRHPRPAVVEPPPLIHKNHIDESNGRLSPIKEFNKKYSVGDVLTRNGYIFKNGAYMRPNSESGIAGVNVCLNCKDSVERVYSHCNDVLNDGYAHDAFDCYRLLERGDLNWNAEITKHNQRIYMAEQEALSQAGAGEVGAFSFSQFSINQDIDTMKKSALEQRYILDGLALLGQATVIYAKPNTGKTLLILFLLVEAVKSGRILGKDIHYVNADDDYNGMLNKATLLNCHRINTVSPGYNGFEGKHLTYYLRQMVTDDSAKGQVIVLDTLKKFTELMDKKIATDFMKAVREFAGHGGTMILLAHTNKNRTADGKAVAGGTSDIIDDVDCAYILDAVSDDNGVRQVLFENIKMRGNVAKTAAYAYDSTSDMSWTDRFYSIERISDDSIDDAKKKRDIDAQMEKDADIIQAVTMGIGSGCAMKTQLISFVRQELSVSRDKVVKVLNAHTGRLWRAVALAQKGEGGRSYQLVVNDSPATANDYLMAKYGEAGG